MVTLSTQAKTSRRLTQAALQKLEKQEENLRKQLLTMYLANEGQIRDAIYSVYTVTGGDRSMLGRNADKSDIKSIKSEVKQVTDLITPLPEGVEPAWPFTVAKFDRLNRLDAFRARVILNQVRLVSDIYPLIMSHLKLHIYEVTDRIGNDDENTPILKVLRNDVLSSLYRNHTRIGDKVARRVMDGMGRNVEAKQAAEDGAHYATRQEQSSVDAVMYYNGTLATTLSVASLAPEDGKYRTVTAGDKDVCSVCRGIEKAQAIKPVLISDMEVGINAPPYHPYCRCIIEVV